jgi:hypothetical protein
VEFPARPARLPVPRISQVSDRVISKPERISYNM